MPARFDTTVSYFENRADGGFAWNVAYDLAFKGDGFKVGLKVKLIGDDPGDAEAQWENGVNDIWNEKVFFSDGKRLHELKFDFSFVETGQHQTVTVHATDGRDNMTNWYTIQPGWGQDYRDEIAAHEVGHMFGAFDEYAGGATFGGFTRTGTLMSDLSMAGFDEHVFGIESFAETNGGSTLSAVAAILGNGLANTLQGTTGMDGFYGKAGADKISGLSGSDFIDGGAGDDTLNGGNGRDFLRGGLGADTLNGGLSADTFIFDASFGGGLFDTIAGYVVADDVIRLDNAVFSGLRAGKLNENAFAIGSAAAQSDDRIIFNPANGKLLFDADGVGGNAGVQFAVITGLNGDLNNAEFVVI